MQRPLGIQISAFYHPIAGISLRFLTLYLLASTADLARMFGVVLDIFVQRYFTPLGVMLGLMAAGHFGVAWALWNPRQWGQAAIPLNALVLVLIGVLVLWVQNQGFPFGLAAATLSTGFDLVVSVVTLVYLFQPEAKSYLGAGGGNWGARGGDPCRRCHAMVILPGMLICPVCGTIVGATEREAQRPLPTCGGPRGAGPTVIGPFVAAAQAWLMVKSGPAAGSRFDLGNDNQIGRERDCAVRLTDDESVSRKHARVQHRDGQFFIQDIGSSTGTQVNGNAVRKPRMLYDGDQIQIGNSRLEFKRTSKQS